MKQIDKLKILTGRIRREDITNTPAFKRWFGKSKIVDKHGKPLVMYHGTHSDFKEFLPIHNDLAIGDKSRSQEVIDWFRDKLRRNEKIGYMHFRVGSFFSQDPSYASHYAEGERGSVYPLYIKAINPVYINQTNREVTGTNPITGVKSNRNRTIDAMVLHDGETLNEVAVIDPTQVKSIYNKGTFDLNNPNILESEEYETN